MNRIACLLAVLLAVAFPVNAEVTFDQETLYIESGDKQHPFTVEIAKTPEQYAQGLMYRTEMQEDHGMLFLFPREQVIRMWMKNTVLSLDMLFLDSDGKIVHIEKNTTPYSTDTIAPLVLSSAVLELLAGTTDKLDIKSGDKVVSPHFDR